MKTCDDPVAALIRLLPAGICPVPRAKNDGE
jgi:hypothetical protein